MNAGGAVPALICGIIAIGLFFVTGSTCSLVSVILGIVAIVMGLKARKAVKANPAGLTGDGLALGGIITGAIGMVLGILVILGGIVITIIWILVYGVFIWSLFL